RRLLMPHAGLGSVFIGMLTYDAAIAFHQANALISFISQITRLIGECKIFLDRREPTIHRRGSIALLHLPAHKPLHNTPGDEVPRREVALQISRHRNARSS